MSNFLHLFSAMPFPSYGPSSSGVSGADLLVVMVTLVGVVIICMGGQYLYRELRDYLTGHPKAFGILKSIPRFFKHERLVWKIGTRSLVYSSPAIGVDGTVYFGSQDGRIYSLR